MHMTMRVEPQMIEGLEFRGVVALLIKDVTFRPTLSHYGRGDEKAWECQVRLNVPLNQNGHWGEVVFGQTFLQEDIRFRVHAPGVELTDRQAMLLWCLREMWQHEWEESVWIGGKPMINPHPEGATYA